MKKIIVRTKDGTVEFNLGDKFIASCKGSGECVYQILDVIKGIGVKSIYMHDETNGRFMDVDRKWFASRMIAKIGD